MCALHIRRIWARAIVPCANNPRTEDSLTYKHSWFNVLKLLAKLRRAMRNVIFLCVTCVFEWEVTIPDIFCECD